MTDEIIRVQIEKFARDKKYRSKYHNEVHDGIGAVLRAAALPAAVSPLTDSGQKLTRDLFRGSVLRGFLGQAYFTGAKMEESVALINGLTNELKQAKAELEDAKNQLFSITSVLLPEMLGHVREIRDMRMAVINETQQH